MTNEGRKSANFKEHFSPFSPNRSVGTERWSCTGEDLLGESDAGLRRHKVCQRIARPPE